MGNNSACSNLNVLNVTLKQDLVHKYIVDKFRWINLTDVVPRGFKNQLLTIDGRQISNDPESSLWVLCTAFMDQWMPLRWTPDLYSRLILKCKGEHEEVLCAQVEFVLMLTLQRHCPFGSSQWHCPCELQLVGSVPSTLHSQSVQSGKL